MAKKRSRSTTARQRIRPAHRWGAYLVAAMLLLMGVTVAAAQMLWASATPEPAADPAVSTASLAANSEVVGNAPAGADGAQTLSLYGGGMRPLVEERDGVQTLNIYGPGGRIIAQVVQDGQGAETVRYLLTDHLGSTRVVLDAEGKTVARYEYAPHGETTAAGTAAGEVRYRYTGHPYDEGQGVYLTPARGYDPTLGRFLSVDPQRQDASPYVYAGNNPVGYVDPTGGGDVPFFVMSGMKTQYRNVGGPLSRSIAEGFGLQIDQEVYDSRIFHSFTNTRGRYVPSLAESNVSWYLSGGGRKEDGTDWSLNKKLYWFIGTDEPVTDPTHLAADLKSMRRMQPGFADEIVVIDFSEDANLSDPIMKELSGLAKSVRLVKAELVRSRDQVSPGRGQVVHQTAEAITHSGVRYTVDKFGDRVDRTRDLDAGVLGGNPSSPQPAGATGTAGQKRSEPSPQGGGIPGSKSSKTSEPIDLSGFHEFPLTPEDYQTTHVGTDLLSALERVPEGAWGMLDP